LPGRAERAGPATNAPRAFRLHAGIYAAVACALVAANWFTGGAWWSFWPLAAWGVALTVHYLIYKAKTVDESWAEERIADLHSKSYDAHHIDRIAEDFGGKAPDSEKKK
jgi:2TM domain-containing protein